MIDLPAPEFELKDLDGETISLMSLKGKVVLLNTENNVIDSYKVSGIPTKFFIDKSIISSFPVNQKPKRKNHRVVPYGMSP